MVCCTSCSQVYPPDALAKAQELTGLAVDIPPSIMTPAQRFEEVMWLLESGHLGEWHPCTDPRLGVRS